jgi:hypothetical protein
MAISAYSACPDFSEWPRARPRVCDRAMHAGVRVVAGKSQGVIFQRFGHVSYHRTP